MQAEIGDLAGPAEAEAFGRFCDWLTGLYQLELPNFIDRNFDSPLDLAWPLGPIIRLVRMGGFRKLNRVVESYFSDPRLQQIFSFQAMYAGLSPFEALALYCVITYMDTVEGVYFPLGGMHAISRGLAAAAEKAGASFRYGTAVEGLVRPGFPTPGSRVTGVRLAGGEVIHADAVVLNPDLPVAYQELLPDVAPPRSTRKGTYSPSCSVWLAGVKGALPEGAAHHNIHFGAGLAGRLREPPHPGRSRWTTRRSSSPAPPSPTRPSPRPAARRSTSSSPCPTSTARSTGPRDGDRLRDRLTAKVAALGYPVDDIEVERFVDPPGWRAAGDGPGHAVRPLPRLLPDRALPPRQRRRQGAGRGVRRLRHRARRGRAHGPALGTVGRRPGGEDEAVTPEAGPITLEDSYQRCRQLNKRYGTTYYWSTALLPKAKRPHVHALYGFCRYADDIVDDLGSTAPVDVRQQAMADFGDRFFADLERGESDDPVLKAVVDTVQRFAIDPDCFRRFMRSMTMDFTVESYETWDDLLVYMDGSAAVIGEMMVPILEPLEAAAFDHARDLGNAFQLSNFLRDVDEDLDRGRVYIPQEDIRKFDADPWARTGHPRLAGPHGLRDRPQPAAVRVGRPRHPHAPARLGPLHPGRPGPVLGHPRPDRGRRLRRVLVPGPGPHLEEAGRRLPRLPPPDRTGGVSAYATASPVRLGRSGHRGRPRLPHRGDVLA